MEFFAKVVNGFQPLSVFIKISILDVWLASRNASEYSAENVAENILKKDATDTRCVNGMTLHKKWSFSLKISSFFAQCEWVRNQGKLYQSTEIIVMDVLQFNYVVSIATLSICFILLCIFYYILIRVVLFLVLCSV